MPTSNAASPVKSDGSHNQSNAYSHPVPRYRDDPIPRQRNCISLKRTDREPVGGRFWTPVLDRCRNYPLVLVRDERHDLMDKKNDHCSEHGKRDGFIDARTADHCHGFHSFPLPCDGAKSRRAVTLHCFGEWRVKDCATWVE